jgi:hypothetical protein
MMQFLSSILAGLTLVRQAIQSSNYVPGVSGWRISADGTCEFVNGIFNGVLTANSISDSTIGECTLVDCDAIGLASRNPRITFDESGTGAANSGIFGYGATPNTSTYNADGNFVVPAGITTISVQLWGAGGGGKSGAGGGGGGGEYSGDVDLVVVPGETLTIDVGAGGAGGVAGANGTAGASSRILRGALVLIEAHGGGPGASTGEDNGGSGSAAMIHFTGGGTTLGAIAAAHGGSGGGGSASASSNGNYGDPYGLPVTAGGAGGSATGAGGAGGDGGDGTGVNGVAGVAGTAPGGGGGAGGWGTVGKAAGAAGAAGRVVVTYLTGVTLQGSIARVPGVDPVTGDAYPAGIRAWITQGSAHTFRTENVSNATLASTDHPIQIGLTTGRNLRVDRAGIEAVNNGAADALWLNVETDGQILTGTGLVTVGNDLAVSNDVEVFGDQIIHGIVTSYNEDTVTFYTPTIGGSGGATWSTRTGWWVRIGPMFFVNIDLVASGAGSGVGFLTATAPAGMTAIERTDKQVITVHCKALSSAGIGSFYANGSAVALPTGSGVTINEMSVGIDNSQNRDDRIQGQDIIIGTEITIQGWLLATL